MVKVRRLTESDFLNMKEEWNTLLQASRADNFFLSWEWLSHWWRHFGKGRELFCFAFYDNDELCGIVPLCRTREILFRHVPVKRIAFLGTQMVHSDYLDFICRNGWEQVVATLFLRYLGETQFDWHLLHLNDIDDNSATLRYLQQASLGGSYHISLNAAEICPYLKLPDTVLAYRSELRKKTRYDVRRGTKDLFARFGQCNVALRKTSFADHPERLPDLLFRLFSLHRTRWAARDRETIFGREELWRFHAELLPELLNNQALTIFSLEVHDEPVAIVYGFTYRGKYYFYQSGFNPEFGTYNPGLILVNFAIECAIECGLSEYDFLRGGEAYKMKFTKVFRRTYHLEIWNSPIRKKYVHILRATYPCIRRHIDKYLIKFRTSGLGLLA
jgi:CelD/BcsL family acetyltransferase involved in cellulose biosynthesis